jgi:hypothetical protein
MSRSGTQTFFLLQQVLQNPGEQMQFSSVSSLSITVDIRIAGRSLLKRSSV